MNANLPYGPLMNTENDFYHTIFSDTGINRRCVTSANNFFVIVFVSDVILVMQIC